MSSAFSISQYLAAHARLAPTLDERAFQAGIDLVHATFQAGKQIGRASCRERVLDHV